MKGIIDVIKLRPRETWDKTYTIAATSALAAVFGQIELAKIIIELESPEYLANVGAFIENFDVVTNWTDSNGMIGEREDPNQ